MPVSNLTCGGRWDTGISRPWGSGRTRRVHTQVVVCYTGSKRNGEGDIRSNAADGFAHLITRRRVPEGVSTAMNDTIKFPEDEGLIQELRDKISAFPPSRDSLIPILQTIQQTASYLPPRALEMVAEHLQVSLSEIYGVATFYNQFRFHPPGKHQIKVCLGTACHVVGGDIILENFERKLGIKEGETTPDLEFGLERVACVGCCALAPVAVVDAATYGHMAPSKVEGILLGFDIMREQAERENRAQNEK